jgi:hypothetical protein
MNIDKIRKSDILLTLSSLSSDEVFTPPALANSMLDLLPKEVWGDKELKFLDLATKSGVFLREATKRLIDSLQDDFNDTQSKVDHIFSHQIYGIAPTELTSLISRRTIYCAKEANSELSISTNFSSTQGNIRYESTSHDWTSSTRCKYCGAPREIFDRDVELENHAYEAIHKNIDDLKLELNDMKFDVIIGNPPYQLETAGAQAQATPLYNLFIEQAIKLNPKYIVMVIPSRWFTGGFGLKSFREKMLEDRRLKILVDHLDAKDIFPGVQIKGGVCYFLWDRDYSGPCTVRTMRDNELVSEVKRELLEEGSKVFIRYNEAIPILKKIRLREEESFSDIVSQQKPFGLSTNFSEISDSPVNYGLKIYGNKIQGWIGENIEIKKNEDLISKYKLFIPKAIGSGDGKTDWVKPIIGESFSVCTETYVAVGPFNNKKITKNAYSYTQTRFFHFLLTLKKNTQDALSSVYELIPLQDFNQHWDDEKLYKKYKLTKKEIATIEAMVRDFPTDE